MKGKKIVCVVSGRETYFPTGALEKKVSKFGTVEEFEKHYVCCEARKPLREGLNVSQARARLGITKEMPTVPFEVLTRMGLMKHVGKVKAKKIAKKARQNYLESAEYLKSKAERDMNGYGWETREEFIRDVTGGPGGGTCQRPDIRVNSGGFCDGCPYHDNCLVTKTRLRGESYYARKKREKLAA